MAALRYLSGVVTLRLDQARCSGCTRCVQVCPHGVLVMREKKSHIVDGDACMECGACARNCPEKALAVQAGVGCATAIIIGLWRGNKPSCGCGSGTSCG